MEVPIYRWKETPSADKERILRRSGEDIARFEEDARKIIDEVVRDGDQALVDQAKRFDGADLTERGIRVSDSEIEEAVQRLDPAVKDAIDRSYDNIRRFHECQLPEEYWSMEVAPGIFAGEKATPISSVAVYVPRGTASYPSVMLMLGIPAAVANVSRIVAVSPPCKDGRVDDATLYAAHKIGITEVLRMGGAGAVAALAFGTETVQPVLKLIGPTNIYGAAAKKILYGLIDVGTPAGPSEAIILADDSVPASLAAADLLIEAEHGPYSAALLVTPVEAFGREIAKMIPTIIDQLPEKQQEYTTRVLTNYGGIILVDTIDEACEFINEYAPEHLEVLTQDPHALLGKLVNAGEIMLGPYTPISLCNFSVGVNAILPTGGRAKTSSVVTVHDFMKRTSISYVTKEGFVSLKDSVKTFAMFEGFPAHARALDARKL
ncbi:MAG: histidinol dehydrogenase [bacterium]